MPAYDVSEWGGPIEVDQWREAYQAGCRLAVVQAWGGGPVPGAKNVYCAQQLSGARQAGMLTAIYIVIPSDTVIETHLLIRAAKEAAAEEYQHVSFVALDVEGEKPLHPEHPHLRLQNAVDHVGDKPVVIYTSRSMWSRAMGTGSESIFFAHLHLWDALYDGNPDLDAGWTSYGGWARRAMKQWKGTSKTPGDISADLNTADLGRLKIGGPSREDLEIEISRLRALIQRWRQDLSAAELELQRVVKEMGEE